jgi:hypothetical protein
MTNSPTRVDVRNAELDEAFRLARAGRGYLVVGIGRGAAVHAATTTTIGHEGYRHPRPLCQPSSSQHYAHRCGDQSADVTCRRCLATLAELEAKAARVRVVESAAIAEAAGTFDDVDAELDETFCEYEGPGPHECGGTPWEHEDAGDVVLVGAPRPEGRGMQALTVGDRVKSWRIGAGQPHVEGTLVEWVNDLVTIELDDGTIARRSRRNVCLAADDPKV